jgi:hypothetical protein
MRSESEMEHELDFLKPVRMSDKGRKDYCCWVIGNQDFVKKP